MWFSEDTSRDTFDEFTDSLSKFTRYNAFRTLASLNYHTDIYNSNSIVSRYENKFAILIY